MAELRRRDPDLVAAADRTRIQRDAIEAERQRKETEAKAVAKEKEDAGREFKSMAIGREAKAFGYTDRSEKWQAFPDELKQKIEDYNRLPKEQRAKELERIGQDLQISKLVREAHESSCAQGRSR